MSAPTYQDHELALSELYHVIGIIPETFVYGIYSCLVPVFIFVMITKGLRTKVRKTLFFMSLFMYSIATIHWSLSVANTILVFKDDFLSSSLDVNLYLPVFSSIILINYLLTDGVVVWRAWVLCSESRRALKIPVVLLFLLAITVTVTIALRIQLTLLPVNQEPILSQALNASQMANLILSLLTNISATTIISMKAWKFRRDITKDFARKQTNGNKVMGMIVESGILYCFSGITVLLASVIRLEIGTLGDIYTPVNFQIAGIYPIVVILLVNQGSSLEKTVFMSTIPHHSGMAHKHQETHLETMRFDIPVHPGRRSSSSETDSYLDDNLNDVHSVLS